MKVFDELLPPGSRLIRVGGDSWNDDGPYCVAVVGHESSQTSLELVIKGLDKPLRPSHWRAVMNYAWERGYESISFRRKRDGREEEKVLRVRLCREPQTQES